MIIMIAAIGENNEIGKENELIWKLKYDLKNFRKMTKDNIIVMGRNTFNSLPKILPDRKHVVLSKTKKFNKPLDTQVVAVDNVLELIKKCRTWSEKKDVYIIGGQSMYILFMDYADKMYITKINATDENADAFFPQINEKDWNKNILENATENGLDISFIEYTRK